MLILLTLVSLAAAKPGPGTLDPTPLERPYDDHFEYRNPDFTADGQPLFESDILLTEEQRSGRQAMSNLWSMPVRFAINANSSADRSAILAGIQHWRDHTCVEFEEVPQGSSAYHIHILKDGGCWSYVGKVWSSGSQPLSIGNGCTGLGTVAHELGHAMGLQHQQSRTDRDTYVQILTDNIRPGYEGNFDIATSSQNYSVPYDLTSVMHYGRFYFAKNNDAPTIRVRDVLHERLIGSREGLSHRDKQLANAMYNCAAGCSSPPTCQNGGFVDKTCQCVCPPRTSGSLCETVSGDYYPPLDCGDADMTSTGVITSPNYPNNFPKNVDCYWMITAPAGQRVKVKITNMMMIGTASDGVCYWDWMDLRLEDVYTTDINACGTSLQGQTFTSVGNKFLLIFHSGNYGWYNGFRAVVDFVA